MYNAKKRTIPISERKGRRWRRRRWRKWGGQTPPPSPPSGPYCEWEYGSEIVEGEFLNYTGSVTNGNRVYMKQFDRSASCHLMVMVEGSRFDGSYENLEYLGESPHATRDIFSNHYFRILDFTKNAFVRD